MAKDKSVSKPWYKKWWGITLIILGALIVIGMLGDDTSNSTPSTTSDAGVQEKVQETVAETQQTIYGIGEDVNVDYLTYKVTGAESFTEMGSSFVSEATNGQFVKVYLEITNNDQESQYIFSPRFRLIDQQDRRYDEFAGAMMYIADGFDFGQQLQPGLTEEGAIVFEVPADSEEFVLNIRGDWVSLSEVNIDIGEPQFIGADTTLQDEQDAMMDEAMADSQRQMDELMQQYS